MVRSSRRLSRARSNRNGRSTVERLKLRTTERHRAAPSPWPKGRSAEDRRRAECGGQAASGSVGTIFRRRVVRGDSDTHPQTATKHRTEISPPGEPVGGTDGLPLENRRPAQPSCLSGVARAGRAGRRTDPGRAGTKAWRTLVWVAWRDHRRKPGAGSPGWSRRVHGWRLA